MTRGRPPNKPESIMMRREGDSYRTTIVFRNGDEELLSETFASPEEARAAGKWVLQEWEKYRKFFPKPSDIQQATIESHVNQPIFADLPETSRDQLRQESRYWRQVQRGLSNMRNLELGKQHKAAETRTLVLNMHKELLEQGVPDDRYLAGRISNKMAALGKPITPRRVRQILKKSK